MTPLQKAAQAVIDRWDSPLWKDQPHTGVYIAELRKALEAEQAQAVEPIGYIRHADKTFWPHPECAVYASVSPSLAPVYAHPAQPVEQAQAVEPVATVQCINGVTIGYLDVMQPVGTKLYTHPVQTPAEAQQVAVPDGWALVPIEPTEEMIVALMCTGLRHAEYRHGCDPTIAHMAQGYTAMLAAAQGAKLVDGKPVILEGGKIGKPAGWTAPDLRGFV
jgi:hypothetical protein